MIMVKTTAESTMRWMRNVVVTAAQYIAVTCVTEPVKPFLRHARFDSLGPSFAIYATI